MLFYSILFYYIIFLFYSMPVYSFLFYIIEKGDPFRFSLDDKGGTEQHETGGSLKKTSDDETTYRTFHKLPRLNSMRQRGSLKKNFRRLSCTPYIPQATTTEQHETGGH